MPFFPETRVRVWPVVLYTKGTSPNRFWSGEWMAYHLAAREKFREMLKHRDTFELVEDVLPLNGRFTGSEYFNYCYMTGASRRVPACSRGAETILAEVLADEAANPGRQYSRWNVPYVFSVLIVDDAQMYGFKAGARSINGTWNRGGGIGIFAAHILSADQDFASTLVHELGHAFGLPHTEDRAKAFGRLIPPQVRDCYYDQDCSRSIMSYDLSNRSNSKDPAQIPGSLLGDDREDLAKNKLVFPDFTFFPDQDYDTPACKRGCPPHDGISRSINQGSMNLFRCYTTSKETHGSSITNLDDHYSSRRIAANNAATGFRADTMWHSGPANELGWVSFEVTFALPVLLNRIQVYTEHSGQHHAAAAMQLEYLNAANTFEVLGQEAIPGANWAISFSPQQTHRWKIALRAGGSGRVVVRGIRFFLNEEEVFAPVTPEIRSAFGETFQSKLSNLVAPQRSIQKDLKGVGFNPKTMWHSGQVNESGWVSLELAFPEETELNAIWVYSRHSKKFHPAHRVQVEVMDAAGQWQFVTRKKMYLSILFKIFFQPEAKVTFPKRRAQYWKLSFQGAKDGHVVIRGLRFLRGDHEVFPAGNG
ncbi:M66 family metalloprotease [Lewinella sp. W8]|uniref:M66 family metalloprotease n=1 Tax=Lewinella sp. W8 TaxID=2528208 RepID=UPI00106742FA|nr:M66 family metalloprotease [Lewinella sp. W8]MTB52096.1 hypothetical protein [Lewinella sp. W8]